MRLEVLKAMNLARRERRAGAVVTRLSNGEQRFVAAELVDADPFGPGARGGPQDGQKRHRRP